MENKDQTQELNTQEVQINNYSTKVTMHLVDAGDALVSFARKIAEEQIASATFMATKIQRRC